MRVRKGNVWVGPHTEYIFPLEFVAHVSIQKSSGIVQGRPYLLLFSWWQMIVLITAIFIIPPIIPIHALARAAAFEKSKHKQ